TRFSGSLCPHPPTRVIRKRLLVAATVLIAFHFICPLQLISYPSPLLTDSRRIILKKLRHHLLQVPVILIRVFLEVDGLDGVAAPDQLLSSDVIQVHQQYSYRDRRRLALHVTAAAPWVPSPARAGTAHIP